MRATRRSASPFWTRNWEGKPGGCRPRCSSGEFEENLEELRDNGFDLPQTAQAYCTEWRNDGILIRRISQAAREETFEETTRAPCRRSASSTSSANRAPQSPSPGLKPSLTGCGCWPGTPIPDVASRLATLREERERIDAQIARVAAGDVPLLSGEQATERIQEMLGLIEEVPGDFARVRAEMEFLNRDLRERLIDVDGPRGTVLEDIFRGVDMLAQSEAGRSFSGFYALLLDPERGLEFEDGIESILDRDFVATLPAAPIALATPHPADAAGPFQRDPRRDDGIQPQPAPLRAIPGIPDQDKLRGPGPARAALRQGMETARAIKPYAKTGLTLDLTSMQMLSVSTMKPHNPADFTVPGQVHSHAPEPVDIEELRALARASEIDMLELTANVNDLLETRPAATIAEVLAVHPATQGVASVVGLLVLAEEHAHSLDGREDVSWASGDSTPRRGAVGRYLFTERIPA